MSLTGVRDRAILHHIVTSDRDAPTYSLESAIGGRVCGVDEAGRGPLAGPVIAAAVVLAEHDWPAGLNDSKQLSAAQRRVLYSRIRATADVGIGLATVTEIDQANILRATLLAMERAVARLRRRPDHVLVDGNRAPTLLVPVTTIVGGDGRSLSIAAASIIAKVTRDRIMTELSQAFPGYGWEHNAGYGTREHIAALRAQGATPHHRQSFRPVRALREGEP